MYQSEMFALVYLCSEVENDGSCSADHVEVEAFSRSTTARPDPQTMEDIVATLKQACFEIEEFEKLDHTGMRVVLVLCKVLKGFVIFDGWFL